MRLMACYKLHSTWKRSTDVTNTMTMSVHSAKQRQPNMPAKWSSSGSKCQNKRRRSSFTTHMHSQFRENPSYAAATHTGRHRAVVRLSGSAKTLERCTVESASGGVRHTIKWPPVQSADDLHATRESGRANSSLSTSPAASARGTTA